MNSLFLGGTEIRVGMVSVVEEGVTTKEFSLESVLQLVVELDTYICFAMGACFRSCRWVNHFTIAAPRNDMSKVDDII